MFRYLLQRIACAVTALLISAAIVMTVSSLIALSVARNVRFVTANIEKSETLLQEIDAAAADAAACAGLPAEALTGALNSSNVSVINSEIARMFIHSYSADYSESTALYNEFYKKLSAYTAESGTALNETQMASTASLAVNFVNDRLSGSDTANVQLFLLSGDNRILYLIIGSAAVIILGIFVIVFLTNGRHRQFSYFGMSLNTAGFVMVLLPLSLLMSGTVSEYRYCVYDVYNTMVQQCYDTLARILMYSGIPFIVAGTLMLLLNYNYYRKKLIKVKESREKMDKIKEDYMETPKARAPLSESEKAEKTFLDVNFED